MLVLPGALIGLIGLHLWLVVRIGVTSPPWSPEAAGKPQPGPAAAAEGGARRAGRREERGSDEQATRANAARSTQRYKEDVKERGKPFYPYAMFHDTVMSLLVVSPDRRAGRRLEVHGRRGADGRRLRLAREALRREGRPGDDELRPAARLVLLLPLLPAADLQVAGVGDPRHGRHPDDRCSCCCSRCRSST